MIAQGLAQHGSALFRLTPEEQPAWQLWFEVGPWSQDFRNIWDPRFGRLLLAGLGGGTLRKEAWGRLLSSADLKPESTRWVLQDPLGKIQASGSGLPSAEVLETTLRKVMGALPWDALEAVLREEPQHGEGRLVMAEWALMSGAWESRFSASRVALATDAMNKLLAIPDWPSQLDLNGEEAAGRLGAQLKRRDSNAPIERMATEVLEALRADPANELLQRNLAFLIPLLSSNQAERMVGDLESVKPLPGQAWPPLLLVHPVVYFFQKQKKWMEVRHHAADWSRPVDRLFLNPRTWDERVRREATLRAYGFQADSWIDGWDVLQPALDSLRKESGANYRDVAKLMLAGAHLPDDPELVKELRDLANRPSLPTPPRSAPLPPWRLKARTPADLTHLKAVFDTRMGLLPWLPVERTFELKADLSSAVTVSLGAETVDVGQEFPVPETLADLLRASRPGRLFVASDHVAEDPEAPGPRFQRMELLLERMPVREAETVLAEDLSRLSLGADVKTWDLDENLWFSSAKRAIPDVEDRLRHWPLDAPRWAALAFWTSFIPSHRGPIMLAEQLPSWKSGLGFSLCLPAELHAKVGDQLQSRHAWLQMCAWFEPAWDQLRGLKSTDPRRTPLMKELGPVLTSFLDRAYAALGRAGERAGLKDEWRRLQAP